MLKPSDFNNAVPKFQNGTYANNPLDPTDVAEPTMEDYVRGVEPLDTLPAQWWNWLCNQFTSRFNKINTYVKNVFDELTQLLSLVGVTPDGTEGTITTGQLKTAFEQRYPNFLSKFIHTIAQIWSYTGSSTSGSVTTTQASRLAVFEKVTASDSSTSPATVTETYNTKYVDTLPVRLGGTGANTKQGALANLTCELTTPEVLPQDADVIINNNGVVQKTSVSSIVSYAGTVSIENSTANCAVPVALCTGFTNVGKSNCCPLTYNPATGALITGNSIGVSNLGACGTLNIICRLTDLPADNQWLLLHDITNWYNCSSSVGLQYMSGRFYFSRSSSYIDSVMLDTVMSHSWGRGTQSLQCNSVSQKFLYNILPAIANWQNMKPVIICENATGKVYTAIRKTVASSGFLSFSGANYGNIINCVVPGGGANVTIPSGWTHLYEAPLGGIVSCAETAMEAESFRNITITPDNCCWIKIGSFCTTTQSRTLELTINRNWGYATAEEKKITILYGSCKTRITEDSNARSTSIFSCIRIARGEEGASNVDIYIKYNFLCPNPTNFEYNARSGNSDKSSQFIPSFTSVSDACASECACKYDIPLHANGHYINGCQFDTTCANTACVNTASVNASCCVNTACVCASQHVYTPTVCATDVNAHCISVNNISAQNYVNTTCVNTQTVVLRNSGSNKVNLALVVEHGFQCVAFQCISDVAQFYNCKAYPVWGFIGNCKLDFICRVNSGCYTAYSGNTCIDGYCCSSTATTTVHLRAIFACVL